MAALDDLDLPGQLQKGIDEIIVHLYTTIGLIQRDAPPINANGWWYLDLCHGGNSTSYENDLDCGN